MIIVSDIERSHTELGAELRASVRSDDGRVEQSELWFRYPPDYYPFLSDTGNAFVPALLLPAMRLNTALRVEAPVSARLRNGADKFMTIMHRWRRVYKPVDIEAAQLSETVMSAGAIGAFFSGGVDSFYTVLKNQSTNVPTSDKISHLIFIHGFDIPLTDHSLHQAAVQAVREMAADLRNELIEATTNLREVSDPIIGNVGWEMFHGQALMSIALGLERLLRRIYIPATHNYCDMFPWGSHPLLDPLWGTEGLHVIHDGCEATRVEKILWQISKSRVALEHLRVCWENREGRYNCGMCGKCIRTMVNLRVAGVLERCKTLDRKLSCSDVANLVIASDNDRAFMKENRDALLARGSDTELVRALEKCLSPWAPLRARRLIRRIPRCILRPLARSLWAVDRTFFGGRLRRWYKRGEPEGE